MFIWNYLNYELQFKLRTSISSPMSLKYKVVFFQTTKYVCHYPSAQHKHYFSITWIFQSRNPLLYTFVYKLKKSMSLFLVKLCKIVLWENDVVDITRSFTRLNSKKSHQVFDRVGRAYNYPVKLQSLLSYLRRNATGHIITLKEVYIGWHQRKVFKLTYLMRADW